MKKITLMIFGLLMSFFAYAQLPKYEFDEPWVVPGASQPASVAAPPDWVVINEFGPIYTWVQTTPGNTSQPPFGGTGHSAFLQRENVAPTAAVPADWLITEAFPMIANAELTFQSRLTINNDNGGVYKVYIAPFTATEAVTVDKFKNTATGTLLTTYTELTLDPLQSSAWTAKTISIAANALYPAGTMVRVAFVMEGDDRDRWFLDDVQVAALCVPPTTPVVTATTTTTATLSWTNTSAPSWEVEVVPDSAVPTGVGEVFNGPLPYVKNGLTPCTNYKFYVRALCADGGKSAWTDPVYFKARCIGETCAEPIVIPPGNQSVTGNTSAYSDFYEGISGTGCGSTGNYLAGNDVVYTYTPNTTGNFNIALSGTGGPAGLFIYSSCANIGISCIGGGTASAAAAFNIPAFSMTAGTTYYFVISTNGTPQTTPYTLTIQQVFCPAPTAGTSSAVTGTTATLSWTPGTVGATSWQLAVQPAGSGLPTAANATTVNTTTNTMGGTTTTPPVPFTPATAYEFYVRESCAGGQYSIWAGPYLFTTTQIPATMPYAQNFDAGAHGFSLNNGTQLNKWIVGTVTSSSAPNSLYVTNDNGATNNYTITTTSVVQAYRDIQMPAAIGQVILSFDWKSVGENNFDYIRVWMVPSSFTPTPGTQITVANSGGIQVGGNFQLSSTWATATNLVTIPTSWNGQVLRLVFEWRNDGSDGTMPGGAVDNINLSLAPCPQPADMAVTTLTPTTGVVSWTASASSPPSYDVFISNTATPVPTPTTTPTVNVTTTSVTINPLVDDTAYFVWVRAHCSDTQLGTWTGPISFTTPQTPANMDYTQNFDGPAPHGFKLSNGTQVNKWFVGTATFNSTPNSLYISNNSGAANAYTATTAATVHAYRDITIPASVPTGQALLQFDWKALANTGDYMRVWIVPITFTPTAGTQITAAASGGVQIGGNFQGSGASTWLTSNNVVTVPASWSTMPRRLVFEWFNNAVTGNQPPAAVDNITFKIITCSAPSALVAGVTTTTSADISWTPPTAVPASYDYYYATNETPPTDATVPSGNSTTPATTITGLTMGSEYTVWVRSNCGGTAGNSFWIGPIKVYTKQVPASIPYVQNFDGPTPHSFTIMNAAQVNKWIVGGATFNSAANSLYVSNDNGVTNAYTLTSTSTVHAYRDVTIPATIASGQILFKFDWKNQGENNFDYIRVWAVPDTFVPTPGTQLTAANSGGTQIGGNYQLSGTVWNTAANVITVPATWNGLVRRFVFEWRNDGGGGVMPPGAVDNLEISVITCPAPSALVLGGLTQNTATVNWTASPTNPASYDYYYSTSPTSPTGATVPSGNVTATTTGLSGLTDNTTYYVWVRSNCGGADGNSFWLGPLSFTTPQIPATLPYTQNFDSGPSLFGISNGTQVNKWVVGGATFNSAAQSMYVSNDNGVTNNYAIASTSVVHVYRDFILPDATANPSNQITLAFDWKNVGENNFDYIRAWVVPITFSPTPGTQITAANSGGFQLGGNLQLSSTWTNFNQLLDVTGLGGQMRRLVFEWRNDGSGGAMPGGAIDNIQVKIVTCPQPVNLAAIGGVTNAQLIWTEALNATSWEYYLVPASGGAPSNNDPVGIGTTVATTSPIVENLLPLSGYKYYVRSLCSGTDISRWSGPYNFSTTPCEIVDQCLFNFILTDSGNNGWGAATMTVRQEGVVVGTLGPQITTGGPVTVTLPLCSEKPYEVFFNLGNETGADECGLQIVNPFNNQTVFNRTAGSPNSDQNTVIYEGMPYCSPITCPQPTELVSESVVNAPGTTQLSWIPGGTETQWELVIQSQGGAFPGNTPATSIIVDDPFYVLPNLVEGQLYEYYVRAICGPDDKSFWSGELRFSLFNPPACADVVVTDPDDVIIVPGTEYMLCPGDNVCVDFEAAFYEGAAETTSYEVTSIPFDQPFPTVGGTSLPVTSDDDWGPKVDLPFEFCFMGGVYNAAQVGANGVISLNANYATGGFNAFNLQNMPIPNPAFPTLNAIYGVYQDTDPNPNNNTWDNPNINYQVLGNYPCRAFVVSFNELAQWSCSSNSAEDQAIGAQSSQIIIYEVTNIIEVYVKRRVPCDAWGGAGVIGIQNAAGTVAFTPPGRNTGNWSAIEEGWRFTPNGATAVQFEWLKNDVPFSTAQSVNVCADPGETVLTARASYQLCSGENVIRETQFTINVQEVIIPDVDPVNLAKCGNGEDVTFDLTDAVADSFADMTGYNFTFYPTEQDAIDQTNAIANPTAFVTNATVIVWVRIMRDDAPCFITRSFEVKVANVAPLFTVTPDLVGCDDGPTTIEVIPDPTEDLSAATYSWTFNGAPLPDTTSSIQATVSGAYVVTVNNNGCIGSATSNLNVYPRQVADDPADVIMCDRYTLPALSANSMYYTQPNGTGTQLNAGQVIGVDAAAGEILGAGAHTIYVYAASPDHVECADENSFVVTINASPVIAEVDDILGCDSVQLSAPAVGSYYTGPDGTGTLLPDNYVVTTTQTIYIYAETGTTPNCSAQQSFLVTISTTPVVDDPADVTECGSYSLPVLTSGTYYATPGGTGNPLSAGDIITAPQTVIYVYAAAPGNPACFAENSFIVNINPIPEFNLGGPYVACKAETVTITVNPTNFDLNDPTVSYAWTENGEAYGGNTSSITASGFKIYGVTVTRGDCVSEPQSVQVDPDTDLVELAVTELCEDNVYSLTVSDVDGSFNPDTATYSWSGPDGFNATSRTIVPDELGEYVVTVTTVDGCVSIDSFEVLSTTCRIPRGISPNNDGFNDEFDLTALGVRKISIFNRYGQEVYSKTEYTKEWHGQGKGGEELPTGTYFYTIERTTGESITGWVYINRQD